jgi:hypothetical protein
MLEKVFFVSYVNNVESKINGSDLIFTLCELGLICSPLQYLPNVFDTE